VGESSTGLQESWGGYMGSQEDLIGTSKGWESSTCLAGEVESLQESLQESRESSIGLAVTCNACRQRNKRAKQARHARHKATYKAPKATREEIERSIQARARLTGEYKLKGTFTRPLIIEDYLNKSS
jgi:methylthioribose-1-phosphate isomerase